jgi:hypothetical protein
MEPVSRESLLVLSYVGFRVPNSSRDFERQKKEGSGNEACLSLCELSEGNLQEGLIYRGPWRIYNRETQEVGISLHRRLVREPGCWFVYRGL